MTKKFANISMLAGILIILFFIAQAPADAQGKAKGKLADKPLFHDPVYDGSTDPTLIWNKKGEKWFMFYTSCRT